MMDYPIVIAPLSEEDGGGYLSYAPDLRGCMSDGETQEEALANLREAMAEWIEFYRESNPGIPVPAPHSASLRVQEERQHLARRLGEIARAHARLDDQVTQLAREVNDIRERIENIEAWAQFAKLTELAPEEEPRLLTAPN